MPRPIQATLDIPALRHNLSQIKFAAPDALVWAVVKANAYGHGIERIFEGLRAADGIALLDLSEAERVRQLGWRGPILLLEGAFETRDLEMCSRLNLWHVVHSEAQIDMLAVHKTHQPHRVFLKMNTGMNRFGLPWREVATWSRELAALRGLEFAGVLHTPGTAPVLQHRDRMPGAVWFEDTQLNFAENL
ncbi:MAG: Alanine racemase, catabolic, partial [Pseudomonadota bacterium]